jgi:hypothetical protein
MTYQTRDLIDTISNGETIIDLVLMKISQLAQQLLKQQIIHGIIHMLVVIL